MTTDQPRLFGGETYDPERDRGRLLSELERVRGAVSDGGWWTLSDLARVADAPEASCSARLRDLRKAKFGAHRVERRYVARGLWEYRVTFRSN